MVIAILLVQVVILLMIILYFLGMGLGAFTGAPYIGTNRATVRAMLDMAHAGKQDVVIDLGCGLGNILLIALNEKKVARVIGYDTNPILIFLCRLRFFSHKKSAQFFMRSIEQMKRHPDVTLVTLYLLPNLMNKIVPVLIRSLPESARIVAHGFAFEDIEPAEIRHVGGATLRLYAMSDLIATHKL